LGIVPMLPLLLAFPRTILEKTILGIANVSESRNPTRVFRRLTSSESKVLSKRIEFQFLNFKSSAIVRPYDTLKKKINK